MSDTLRCNYCHLQQVKHDAQRRGQVVETHSPSGDGAWVEVYVNGCRVVTFAELSEHCAC